MPPPPTIPLPGGMFVLGGATAGSKGSNSGWLILSHSGLPGFGHDDPWQAQTRRMIRQQQVEVAIVVQVGYGEYTRLIHSHPRCQLVERPIVV